MTATQTPAASATKTANLIGGGGLLAGIAQIALGYVASTQGVGHPVDHTVLITGMVTAATSILSLIAHQTVLGHKALTVAAVDAPRLDQLEQRITAAEPKLESIVEEFDPQLPSELAKATTRLDAVQGQVEALVAKTGLTAEDVRDIIAKTPLGAFGTAVGKNPSNQSGGTLPGQTAVAAPPDATGTAAPGSFTTPPAPAAPAAADPATQIPQAPLPGA